MRHLVLEITSKDGVRIERVVLGDRGLSIGRAWNSDIIVQDRFVDPDHLGLSLNEEQQILIADFSTVNGSRLVGRHLDGVANPYQLGDLLTIGDTRIKIFDAQNTVEPTAHRSNWFLLTERFSRLNAFLVLTLFALLAGVIEEVSGGLEPLELSSVIAAALGVLLVLLVWSSAFGFLAKLLRGESNFKALWILGCLGVITLNCASLLLFLMRFNLQDVDLGSAISAAVFTIISIVLFAGVLSYTTHLVNRNKWLFSLLLVASVYGISQSEEYLSKPHQKWSASTSTEQATLPPIFLLRKGVSVDDYFEQADLLFDAQ